MDSERFERLHALFRAALEVPEGQREAFLAAASEDPAILAQVRGLLRHHTERDETFVAGVDAAGREALLDADDPEVIGPYTIVRRIGQGGMGVVYLADQAVPVRRQVALKVIKLGMDSRAIVARFEQERQTLAMMEHAGIAKVFDCGTTERGQPFFAMEFVRGRILTKYCDGQNLTVRERIALVQQVCAAVQHAHQKGVVHRDLTPANILVSEDGGRPFVKVIDFGLAKAMGPDAGRETALTAADHFLGTPEYMAPEQAESGNRDIDTRADVYSLGVILYELLVGSLPFPSHVLRALGIAEMQRVIRETDPPRPSARLGATADAPGIAARRGTSTAWLGKALRGDLDWVVLKAIDKDRSRRYASAAALEEDLQRFLDQEPLMAGPPSAGYRLRKFVARRRGLVAAIVGVMFGLAAVLAVEIKGSREIRVLRVRETVEAARSKVRLGRWDEALAMFRAAAENGDAVDARLGEAEVLEASLRYEEARNVMTDVAARADLGSRRALVELLLADGSRVSADASEWVPDAVHKVVASGDLGPADAHYGRAIVAASTTEAMRHLDAALIADPGHRRAGEMQLTLTLLHEGPEAGIRVADQFLRIHPRDPCAATCKALCLWQTNQPGASNVLKAAGLDEDVIASVAVTHQLLQAAQPTYRALEEQMKRLLLDEPDKLPLPRFESPGVGEILASRGSFTLPLRLPPAILTALRDCAFQFFSASVGLTGNERLLATSKRATEACPQAFAHYVHAVALQRTKSSARDIAVAFRDAARAPDLVGVHGASLACAAVFGVKAWGEAKARNDESEASVLSSDFQEVVEALAAMPDSNATDAEYRLRTAFLLGHSDITPELAVRWRRVEPDSGKPFAYLALMVAREGLHDIGAAMVEQASVKWPKEPRLKWAAERIAEERSAPANAAKPR